MTRKITEVGKDVSYMRGELDATLPTLARTTEVKTMIDDHRASCNGKRSLMPSAPKSNGDYAKLIGKVVAALGAVAAAVWGLVDVISKLVR